MCKMKYVALYAIVIMIFVYSCSSKRNTNEEVINISFSKENLKPVINSTDIFDSFKLIKLETRDESLIGNIFDVKIVDELIYIGNRVNGSRDNIVIFNINGDFIRKINNIGKGPGEYTQMADFDVNSENGEVYIHDYNQNKLVVYDKTGTWKRDIKIDFKAIYFVRYKNSFCFDRLNFKFLNDNKNDFDLLLCNEDGVIKNKLFPYRPYIESYVLSWTKNPLQVYEDSLLSFLPKLSRNIYELEDEHIIKRYFLEYENFIDESDIKPYVSGIKAKQSVVEREMKDKGKVLNLSHVNGPAHIHLFWDEGGEQRYVWYEKSNGRIVFYKKMNNDLCELPIGWIFEIRDDLAYSIVDDFSDMEGDVLESLNLKEDSNPVIVQYKLK